MSSTLWPNRSKAAPARCLPRPATTSWPRLLNLKYAMPAALSRLDSSRISGCPEENADPRPCTQMRAVRRRRRTALIWVHGLGSAFSSGQPLIRELSRRLNAAGIAYFKFNNRGHDVVAGRGKHLAGAAFERFGQSIE